MRQEIIQGHDAGNRRRESGGMLDRSRLRYGWAVDLERMNLGVKGFVH